jgi:hypothetical protein
MKSLTLAVVLLFLSMGPLAVVACSVGESFILPTNYDLVKEAEAIVLAEAVDYSRKRDRRGDPAENTVGFAILEVLKGDVATQRVTVEGYLRFFRGRSAEGDFSRARPGAYSGSCIAMDYRLNHKYLLFLDGFNGGWGVRFAAFSRVNEEVDGIDSPWVKAVKTYVRIGSLNDYDGEKKALNELLTDSRDSVRKEIPGLIEDIERHFNRPSPHKSFEDNLQLYRRAETAGVRRQVLWAYVNGGEEKARPFVREMLKSGEWKEYMAPVSEYLKVTRDKESVNLLLRTFVEIEGQRERWPMLGAIIELADSNDGVLMLDVLRSANEEEAAKLASWFANHPSVEATEFIRNMVNKEYQSKWELAFGLAGLGDPEVVEWAKGFSKSSDEDRWMGCYIIARSPLSEADIFAKEIILQNDPKILTHLVQGYWYSFNPNKWGRLADIIQLRSDDEDLNYWLERILSEMARDGEKKAVELLRLLERKND